MLYISKLFLCFVMYSFVGWILEVLYGIYKDKRIVNRGFLIGPLCPIYGFGGLLIYILLSKFADNGVAVFLMSCLICSILEYTASYVMEKIFHVRFWDYEYMKFNINGRICLEMIIPFGVLGLFVVYMAFPYTFKLIELCPNTLIFIISALLFILLITDFIISIVLVSKFKKNGIKTSKDNTEEISKYVRTVLIRESKFTRRLVDTFPNFKLDKKYFMKKKKN